MKMQTVQSTNIHAIGYEPSERRLRVQFLRKGVDDEGKPANVPADTYDYDDVPEDLHHELMQSDKLGATFALKVRKGPFKYRKVEPSGDK